MAGISSTNDDFAFCSFHSLATAQAAMTLLNGTVLDATNKAMTIKMYVN
jgi:hypothetical protein